jgi:hypothetical protein
LRNILDRATGTDAPALVYGAFFDLNEAPAVALLMRPSFPNRTVVAATREL